MRRRIVWSTVAVVALAVVTFAVPLGIAVRSAEYNRALDTVQVEAEQAAALLGSAQARTLAEAGLILSLLAQQQGTRFTLFDATGGVLVDSGSGTVPPPDAPTVATLRHGEVARAHVDGSLRASVPLRSTSRGGIALRAMRDAGDARGAVARSLLLIGVGAAGVVGLAVVGASLQAQRLSQPFEALADSAHRLGRGDFTTRAARSGLEEADAIAEALDTTAERLGRALDRGTAFAADASHQLRTPLTALRLHLESLAEEPGHPTAVDDALAEADRLHATIEELVTLTRPSTDGQRIDVTELVGEHLAAWRSQLAAHGREIEVDAEPVDDVRARPAAVSQALQVLIDNAARHGAGTVTLRLRPTARGDGVRLDVVDEGTGVPPHVIVARANQDRGDTTTGEHHGGRGLALARSLIEAEGGSLVVDDGVPRVVLPRATLGVSARHER